MPIDDLLSKVDPAQINGTATPAKETPAEDPAPEPVAEVVEEQPDDHPGDEGTPEPSELPETPENPGDDHSETVEEPEPEPEAVTPAATPAKPAAPAPAATPPASPVEAAPDEFEQVQLAIAALKAKRAAGTFDPVEDAEALADLVIRQNDLFAADVQARRQEREVSGYWQSFAAKNPKVGADRGQKMYQQEFDRAQTKGYTGEAARAVATEMFNMRVKQVNSQPPREPVPPKPATAPPRPTTSTPPTQGGGRVTPPGNPARPPVKAKTPEERLRSAVKASDVRNFLR
jgi:hypothetical protein